MPLPATLTEGSDDARAREREVWPRRPPSWAWRTLQQALSALGSDLCVTDVMEIVSRLPIAGLLFARAVRRRVLRRARGTRAIFIHVPRNAGTAISRAIYRDDIPHHKASFLRRIDPKTFARIPSFAVLRDPYDRFLSMYSFVNAHGTRLTRMHPHWARKFHTPITVDGFLDVLESERDRLAVLDYVMRPQADYVLDDRNRILVERLFLLGRDNAELEAFLLLSGGDRLSRINDSAPLDIRLTPQQKARVRRLYARDFDLISRAWPGL